MTGPEVTAFNTLVDLETLLRGLPGDADLHRAHPDGGWTCAQVVTHISLSALLWVADLHRFAADPELTRLDREDLGHDVLGAIPATAAHAADRIASTREALIRAQLEADPEVLDRDVEIPPLGVHTVHGWSNIVAGHIADHLQQIRTILEAR